jgi:hypothetical protein
LKFTDYNKPRISKSTLQDFLRDRNFFKKAHLWGNFFALARLINSAELRSASLRSFLYRRRRHRRTAAEKVKRRISRLFSRKLRINTRKVWNKININTTYISNLD